MTKHHNRQRKVWHCPRCQNATLSFSTQRHRPRKCLFCGKGRLVRKS